MKKKLGDLTLRESADICETQDKCNECPMCIEGGLFCGKHNPMYYDEEIEVDDEA